VFARVFDRANTSTVAPRALGKQGRTLRFAQLDCAAFLGIGFFAAPGRAQCSRQCQPSVGVVEQRVRGRRDPDRFVGKPDRLGVFTALRQCLGTYSTPGDGSLQVVPGQRLALPG
jgi:hypothetical protein